VIIADAPDVRIYPSQEFDGVGVHTVKENSARAVVGRGNERAFNACRNVICAAEKFEYIFGQKLVVEPLFVHISVKADVSRKDYRRLFFVFCHFTLR
jgi:hypothetical protein